MPAPRSLTHPADPTEAPRRAMVQLIARRDVRVRAVLRAMRGLPRHLFVPEAARPWAYADHPVPIGDGQTISQPYIVAYMTAAARVKPGQRVLEVGTGCGYQTAVLAALGAEVYSVEIVPALARAARQNLRAAGIHLQRVHLRQGDASAGWPEAAPFDAILVTAAPPEVPAALRDQLAEGGRLVIPVGPEAGAQDLQVWRRVEGRMRVKTAFGVRFVPMTGAVGRA